MSGVRVGSAVAAGGFAGAVCRYAVGLAVAGPAGTLVANVAGCLLLSVVTALPAEAPSTRTRALVATGYLSSFTTYSTFALESVAGGPAAFAAIVLANYGLGLAAVLAGRAVLGLVVGPPEDDRDGSPDGDAAADAVDDDPGSTGDRR